MKTIKIQIPDNLNEQEEVFAIAKQLSKKRIGTGKVNRIGEGVEVQHITTNIVVERVHNEPVVIMKQCSVCKTEFNQKKGVALKSNYGGTTKTIKVCSKPCANTMVSLIGSRVYFQNNKHENIFTKRTQTQ